MRVLGAFGNMGFEDYRWLADDDLKLLVVTGQAEIRHTQDRHRTLTASKEAAGNPLDASQIDKQVKTIAGMQRRLQPYAEELARRHSASPPLVTRDTPDER
jgi:hypothetical protein